MRGSNPALAQCNWRLHARILQQCQILVRGILPKEQHDDLADLRVLLLTKLPIDAERHHLDAFLRMGFREPSTGLEQTQTANGLPPPPAFPGIIQSCARAPQWQCIVSWLQRNAARHEFSVEDLLCWVKLSFCGQHECQSHKTCYT